MNAESEEPFAYEVLTALGERITDIANITELTPNWLAPARPRSKLGLDAVDGISMMESREKLNAPSGLRRPRGN